MGKEGLRGFISILLLLPFASGLSPYAKPYPVQVFYQENPPPASFEKPCHTDQCASNSPKCPLCPSSNSISRYFYQETGPDLPILMPSFLVYIVDTFADQEFVTSVFRP